MKTWRTFGLGESQLANKLKRLYPLPDSISIGYRAKFPEVHVVLKTSRPSKNSASIISTIENTLQDVIVGVDSKTLLDNVANKLIDENACIVVAESCTGGLIAQLLTSVSGSSQFFDRSYVTYSNQSKVDELNVELDTTRTHDNRNHNPGLYQLSYIHRLLRNNKIVKTQSNFVN